MDEQYRQRAPIRGYSPIFNIPPEILEKRSIVKTISSIGIVMLLFMILYGVIPKSFSMLMTFLGIGAEHPAREIIRQLLGMLFQILLYMIPAMILYFIQGYHYHFSGMFHRPKLKLTLCAVPIVLAVAVLSFVGTEQLGNLLALFHVYVLQTNYVLPNNFLAVILFLISHVFVSAFFQEFFFHGVILHSLRRHGDTVALILSSLLFALVQPNLFSAIQMFLVEMAIGYFVLRSGSLLTGIALHLAYNCFAAVILLIPQTSFLDWQLTINLIYVVCLILGILGTVILVNRDPNMFRLIQQESCFSNSQKIRYACGNIFLLAFFFVCGFSLGSSLTVI